MAVTATVALCTLDSAASLFAPADILTRRRWAPRVAPLSLADPRRPTLQVGAEYFLLPRLNVGADVGTRLVLLKGYRQPEQRRRHQTYRAEVRYYVFSSGWEQQFVAAEGFYVPYAYTSQGGTLERNGAYFTYDEARIVNHTRGADLKYGWVYSFGPARRWWFETAVGIGWRRVPARYSRIRNEQPADSARVYGHLNHEWQFITQPADGSYIDRAHITLSLRVGYRLWRRGVGRKPD